MIEILGVLLISAALGMIVWNKRDWFAQFKPKVRQNLAMKSSFASALMDSNLDAWTKRIRALAPSHWLERISKRLERAGRSGTEAPRFFALQVLGALIGLFAGLIGYGYFSSPALLVSAPIAGFFWLSMKLNARIRVRQREIMLCLPYYFDLLTLAIEAGLDLIAAVEEVVEHDSPNALREELMVALKSIRMGHTRSQAFTALAERTSVEPLALWAASVRQSEELGSSIGQLLRLQSETIRRELFRDAEERAQRAPMKMLLPLIGLIFPVAFILLFGPIGIALLSGS